MHAEGAAGGKATEREGLVATPLNVGSELLPPRAVFSRQRTNSRHGTRASTSIIPLHTLPSHPDAPPHSAATAAGKRGQGSRGIQCHHLVRVGEQRPHDIRGRPRPIGVVRGDAELGGVVRIQTGQHGACPCGPADQNGPVGLEPRAGVQSIGVHQRTAFHGQKPVPPASGAKRGQLQRHLATVQGAVRLWWDGGDEGSAAPICECHQGFRDLSGALGVVWADTYDVPRTARQPSERRSRRLDVERVLILGG
eukprot:scaffold26773_cov125-Isochrysis_galbana.AAC.1